MENNLIECPAQETIKPEIENEALKFVISSNSSQDFDEEGPPKLVPNYSEIIPIGVFTETSEEAPLKKPRYESSTEKINGCELSQQMPQNKEIIKKNFKCRFCSFSANTDTVFTMHLLQHVTGQSITESQEQDKNMNNPEINITTSTSTNSTNSDSPKTSISITITAPKDHRGSPKDIKRSIVDEILKKLGFADEESEAEDNINNEIRNKDPELTSFSEKNKGNLNTHKNNGETKTGQLIKTYARKSPVKSTPTKPLYDSFIAAPVDLNIEPIADSNQLPINSSIDEELNVELDSSYHILKNVIHAEINASDETHYYQFVPNNVKEIDNNKTEYSLFSIETAHDSIQIPFVESTSGKKSSRRRSKKQNSNSNQLIDGDAADYECYENKVTMPTDINFGHKLDFQCQYCPTRTAPEEKHFLCHYRMHFTKKGIQCPFCSYRSMKSNVLKHLFCHSPSNPFMCPLCHIKKTNKEALTDHLKIAHSKQLFEKHDSVCRSWYCAK